MSQPTGKSWVERDLRSPKHRMRVETDEKKEQKIQGYEVTEMWFDEYIDLDEELSMCQHNYLAGCPFCKQK